MKFEIDENRFFMKDEDGDEIAEVTFRVHNDDIIIDHTWVSSDYRGRGIAQALVARVVEKARTEEKKIIPLCPFAKAEFKRVPEYQVVEKKY